MCILMVGGMSLGLYCAAEAAREAKFAARLFGEPVTVLNLQTRRKTEWMC